MKPQYIKIDEDGDKFYYSDKEMKIYHRENGPACEWADGDKRWYLNGIKYSEEKFNEKMKPSKKININGKEFTIEELNSLIAKALIKTNFDIIS